MILRLLATSFTTALLLTGTFGCSKKDDPVATNTGTYTLDGVVTPCQVTASTRSGIADYLDLKCTPTDPQHSGDAVLVYFTKPTDAPASTYELTFITLIFNGISVPYFVSGASATISQLSSGGYSGTFSATSSRFTTKVITAGAFTNVQL